MKRPAATHGFTLVELLVVIVIVVVLASLSIAGLRSARQKAMSVTEVSAARNLVAGYLGYAADNNGKLLPGFKKDPAATNLEGKLVPVVASARYPWRLAPSVPAVKGVMFYNGNEVYLEDQDSDYKVSVFPNMGINATFVGGSYGGGSPDADSVVTTQALGKYYVSSMAEVDDPSKLLVFASARHIDQEKGKIMQGYFKVDAPNTVSRKWGSNKFEADGSPGDHGFVDFRWNGKAVIGMLGGNVELVSEDALRDMRRWSNLALRANDKNHILTPSP